ncbi:MAG: Ig-like domain-containing protein [Gallionellaceae bacterium]|jgi:hypothetical protein
MQLKAKQKVILTMILASGVVLTGCSQPANNSNANTVTTTSTVLSSITPVGTLQGVLIDAMTQQPIVGAIVDVGLSRATTNADGQFVLANLPANNAGTLTGNYEVSINLKGVTSPVNMADITIKNRYPDFVFQQAVVSYVSDVGHPLTGVAKGYQFAVGKLAATISGEVTDENGRPVAAGYKVTLHSAQSAQNSATGGISGQQNAVSGVVNTDSTSGNVVSTATTDASGKFTFANIEAGGKFTLSAQDIAYTVFGELALTAPAEMATRTLSFQNGDSIVVKSTDSISPKVVSVTPEHNSDITPGATDVVFTFSEPIKQTTVVKDISPSNPNGLYSLVDVNFIGAKPRASNMEHSMAWSSDRKQLTVSLPVMGASSMYTVDISRAQAELKDDAGNSVAAIAGGATKYSTNLAVDFTTKGGATVAAPVIALVNDASINAASTTTGAAVKPTLDWLPVSGAKGYKVYRTMSQVWGATTISHPTELITPTTITSTNFTDTFAGLDYVENTDIKLTYSYSVRSVNSDAIESAASNAVTADDMVAPSLLTGGAVVCGSAAVCSAGKVTSITIPFDERMEKLSTTTATNFTSPVTGIAFSGVSYDSVNKKATLTLNPQISPAIIPYATVTTGIDGKCQTTAAIGDNQVIAVGKGISNSTCIRATSPGNLLTATVAVGSDDVVTGAGTALGNVSSGPDGICQTTAAVGDTQVIAVGNGQANSTAIILTSGAASITVFGDDINNAAGGVVIVSGVKDVAGNSVGATSKKQYNADGTVN